jgi:hypothetical protein
MPPCAFCENAACRINGRSGTCKIPGLGKDDMLDPDAIAETFWQLAHQHRSAWTMGTEVRPFKEKF